jgi:hypothetical protein
MLFHCEIVRVYAANTVTEKSTLWDELTILKSSFDVPVLGDFNETLRACKRRSGYLNLNDSKSLKSFLTTCDFI